MLASWAACVTSEEPDGSNDTVRYPRDGGTRSSDPEGSTALSVRDAAAASSGVRYVSIHNAVVVAANSYVSGGGTAGTFYVQDKDNPGGPGLAVYHSSRDTTPFPAVGDVVSVSGHLGRYSGSLQVSTSTKYSHPLAIAKTGSAGATAGGAYPPAGQPIRAGSTADYSSAAVDNHRDQVGNVLRFDGPLSVTNANAIVETDMDGGTKPKGFEVTGGMVVNDNLVWYDCMKKLDGGIGALDLTGGITGVWDRYQDFYGGTAQDPAPVVPVLVPTRCADIGR